MHYGEINKWREKGITHSKLYPLINFPNAIVYLHIFSIITRIYKNNNIFTARLKIIKLISNKITDRKI